MTVALDPLFVRSGRMLAGGLMWGAFVRDDAAAWADAWILQLDVVPDGLWELSMPDPRDKAYAPTQVEAIVGRPSDGDAFAIVVAALDHALRRGRYGVVPAINAVAVQLRDVDGGLAPDVEREVYQLEDDAEHADDQVRGTPELAARFAAFALPFAVAWSDAIAMIIGR